jgi:hypothetical protein
MGELCLSFRFSGTTQRISLKFGIEGIKSKLLEDIGFGWYRFNGTATSHAAQIELYRFFFKNGPLYRSLLHDMKQRSN